MEKVLIAIREIADYSKEEMVCVSLARELDDIGFEVSVFGNNIAGNESTERLRTRGIAMYDVIHNGAARLEDRYDAIVAMDEWAIENIPKKIQSDYRFKFNGASDIDQSVKKIMDRMKGKPAEVKANIKKTKK